MASGSVRKTATCTRASCFFIGRNDDYSNLRELLRPEDWLDLRALLRTSELGTPFTKAVGMLNYAPHPIVEDLLCVANQTPVSILADTLEYDRTLPEVVERCFTQSLSSLVHYPELR